MMLRILRATPLPSIGPGGFTFLELMIALAVIVLISAVLGGVLRLGSRAWERGEREAETQQRNRDLVGLLSRELRSAYPYQLKDELKVVYFFEGAGQRVRFVSSLSDPSRDGQAPLRVVTFFFERGRGLFVRSTPLLGGGLPPDERGSVHLLDSGVQEFGLRYLTPEGWASFWEPKQVQPANRDRGRRGGATDGSSTPGQDLPIPRAVEVTLTLAASRIQGPIVLPILAVTELRKTNPAGRPGS